MKDLCGRLSWILSVYRGGLAAMGNEPSFG
jgi:hypothetical protein